MAAKKLILIVLFISIFSSLSIAQKDSVRNTGQWQFFMVNDYSLAYSCYLSQNSQLRYKMDVGFGASIDNSDSEYMATNFQTASTTENEGSNYNLFLDFSAQYLWLVESQHGFQFSLGGGPLIAFSRNFNENEEQSTSTNPKQVFKNSMENTSFGIGVQMAFMLEYLFSSKVSLFAEYDLNAVQSWQKDILTTNISNSTTSETRREVTGTSFDIGLRAIRFGVGIRF